VQYLAVFSDCSGAAFSDTRLMTVYACWMDLFQEVLPVSLLVPGWTMPTQFSPAFLRAIFIAFNAFKIPWRVLLLSQILGILTPYNKF